MSIELLHLHPGHDDELSRLKERIAELEKLNHDLCERVTENDEIRLHWEEIEQTRAENERMKARIAELEARNHDLEEEHRWRKFSEEKPKEDTEVLVLVLVDILTKRVKSIQIDTYTREEGFASTRVPRFRTYGDYVTHWMPLPSAPKEAK